MTLRLGKHDMYGWAYSLRAYQAALSVLYLLPDKEYWSRHAAYIEEK